MPPTGPTLTDASGQDTLEEFPGWTTSPALATPYKANEQHMGYFLHRSVLAAAVLGLVGVSARADVTIDITQQGTDVVIAGSGTLNITGLSFVGSGSFNPTPNINPNFPALVEGPAGGSSDNDEYGTITGPTSFGPGSVNLASSGTGSAFGIESGYLLVPVAYVSGQSLSATDTYSGATFSSLGLTPGTYTWTWGTGANADSFTVQIGAAAAVPEPSTGILAMLGAVAFLTHGWYGHRRKQRQQAAA
jgi:PEP-CTERM motif